MRDPGSLFGVVVLACVVGCGPKANGGKDGGKDGGNAPAECTLPATITANMTLTTACTPWLVTTAGSSVAGTANPVLTIEAGVTLAFDSGAFLSVGEGNPGGLVAVGTASAPITFTSNALTPAPGDWASVALADQTLPASEIAFASFEYGGAPTTDGFTYAVPAGTLVVASAGPLDVPLHDLTITHSAANGLVLDGMQVGYGAASGNLTVNDWGSSAAPFVISADAASTIPTSLIVPAGGVVVLTCGNNCTPGTAGHALVDVTQTWPALPIPYLVDGTGSGLQIEGAGSTHATLTIAGPNTLEFESGGDVEIDPNGSAQADLVADNVTFTSTSPTPTAGAWAGLHFIMTAAGFANSSLTDCTVDYAGGFFALPAGIGSCNGVVGPVFVDNFGNTVALGPTITGCTIENYPADNDGIITAAVSTTSTSAYATDNTFSDLTVCSL